MFALLLSPLHHWLFICSQEETKKKKLNLFKFSFCCCCFIFKLVVSSIIINSIYLNTNFTRTHFSFLPILQTFEDFILWLNGNACWVFHSNHIIVYLLLSFWIIHKFISTTHNSQMKFNHPFYSFNIFFYGEFTRVRDRCWLLFGLSIFALFLEWKKNVHLQNLW